MSATFIQWYMYNEHVYIERESESERRRKREGSEICMYTY